MNLWKIAESKWFEKLTIGAAFLLLLALLWRDPFSIRNTISNLDPFPDSLYYTLRTWNWINGEGYRLAINENEQIEMSNYPIYGFLSIPFFYIFKDIRSFYFLNVLISFGIVGIFIAIAKKTQIHSKNFPLPLGLSLFLLVSNFYFYTQPELMMTELLYTLVFLVSYYLMLGRTGIKKLGYLILCMAVLWWIKASDVVLVGILLVWFYLKAILEAYKNGNKKQLLLWLVTGVVVSLIVLIPNFPGLNNQSTNTSYFLNNLSTYLKLLTSNGGRYLWFEQRLVTQDLVVLGLMGLVVGLWQKKTREAAVGLLLTLILYVGIISFFRDTEGRHLFIFIPFYCLSVYWLISFISSKSRLFGLLLVPILFVLNILFTSHHYDFRERTVTSIKRQLLINFKYQEEPWNYKCTEEFNKFFNSKGDNQKYLASFLPYFYLRVFGNNNYDYLPLSTDQDFMLLAGLSKHFTPPLKNYYLKLLSDGSEVYYSDYLINGNYESWSNQLREIIGELKTEKVYSDDRGICNIYRIYNE